MSKMYFKIGGKALSHTDYGIDFTGRQNSITSILRDATVNELRPSAISLSRNLLV